MFFFVLEFWFWTLVVLVGIGVALAALTSEAFWSFAGAIILIAAGAGLIAAIVSLDLESVLAFVGGGAALIAAVSLLLILFVSHQRRVASRPRQLTRQELLNAVTRYRVFTFKGLDDSGNVEGMRADHGFSEQEIAENAKKIWGADLPLK